MMKGDNALIGSSGCKVSVIIPIYNLAQYLPRCFESVISQSYKNVEIIMVNDGSTDNSGEVAQSLALTASDACVINQANQGPAAARKAGLLKATGDYVVFLDSDDTLPHDAIEVMVKMCEEHKLDAFYGLHCRVLDDGSRQCRGGREKEGVIGSDEMVRNLLNPAFVYCAGMCFSRRDKWDASMFCNNRELPGEDILTNLSLVLGCNRIGIYNKWVYNYFYTGNSLTSSRKYFKYRYWKNYYREMRRIIDEQGKLPQFEKNVQLMEIDSLAFYVSDINTSDQWYKNVMKTDVKGFSPKIRLLHVLLRCPKLLRACVETNRWMKKILSRRG